MDLSHLSPWQRIRRRVALLGGSYTHPDGHIELDFEGPAGIHGRNDSDEVQSAKLIAYEQRRAASSSKAWAFLAVVIVGATLIHHWPSLWPF
ncbi:MAG: hypothetical protein O9972_59285 [Burkholderiales bacterium]|nr:hypothetical protein [Burkholderiales bacterium]